MKDSMEFDEEEQRESESNWQMGVPSTPSFEALRSRSVLQSHNLQILFKREKPSERRVIPATLHEKLSFYRAFVSSPSKLVSMQVLFNKYLWFYLFNLFCKSLPSTYVYVFLSSYAAEDHFFVSKMIPLFYGHIWYSIISAFIASINACGYIALLWDYVISGLLYKNPWNRCDPYYNLTTDPKCYEVKEFTRKIANQTLLFSNYGYLVQSNITAEPVEYFQLAPILFLKSRLKRYAFGTSYFRFFETIVFLIACLSYKQLFQKYIWKILHYTQVLLCLMYSVTFCHLVAFYFIHGFKKVSEPIDERVIVEMWNVSPDIDVLAESMTSPPIIHILSARSTEKPKPSRDSTRIIASNAVYYMFRSLLAYMMKRYCEHTIGTTLLFLELNQCSSFFYWPIYFSYFYLGDYYTLIYFLLNGIEEFLVMAITLYCLIEAVICEWLWMKPWHFVTSISLMAILAIPIVSVTYRGILYVYMTCFSTLSETIVVFWMYPLGRLIDDITFHTGAPPTTLRIWNLRMVPAFYTAKLIILLNGFLEILRVMSIDYKLLYASYNLLYVQAIPFILGAFYALYVNICREKQGWKQLFIPVPEWGPKDPKVRRLRNQYDSRQYIGSQAPRELSRYLIEKAELKTYRVDIQYGSRYKTQRDLQSDVRFEDEKKNE